MHCEKVFLNQEKKIGNFIVKYFSMKHLKNTILAPKNLNTSSQSHNRRKKRGLEKEKDSLKFGCFRLVKEC